MDRSDKRHENDNEKEYEERRRGREHYRYERDNRDRRSKSRERREDSESYRRHRESYHREHREHRDSRDSREYRDEYYREGRSREEPRGDYRNDIKRNDKSDYRNDYRETRVSPRDKSPKAGHHRDHSHKLQSASRYDLPTTESLHAKKLAALDHEKFLVERQKERLAKGKVEGLWPKTPPRAEFYFGDTLDEFVVNEEKEEEDNNVKAVETSGVNSLAVDTDDPVCSEEELDIKIRVKAPSAPKPSINSFSTSKPTKYGGDLMPGEGTAMAGFIAQGQRIPRRGEIGLDSDQISRFESAGYVMSGSRHHLMNAVRMRKENQVISAEEKRMISQMALEERVKREEEIVKTFRSMVEEKMKQQQQKK